MIRGAITIDRSTMRWKSAMSRVEMFKEGLPRTYEGKREGRPINYRDTSAPQQSATVGLPYLVKPTRPSDTAPTTNIPGVTGIQRAASKGIVFSRRRRACQRIAGMATMQETSASDAHIQRLWSARWQLTIPENARRDFGKNFNISVAVRQSPTSRLGGRSRDACAIVRDSPSNWSAPIQPSSWSV